MRTKRTIATALLCSVGLSEGLLVTRANAASSDLSSLTARDDRFTVDAGAILELPVLENDKVPTGANPWIASFTLPAEGSLSLGPNGVLVFTAPKATARARVVRFRYQIKDGVGNNSSADVVIALPAGI
jgi:hypothetical protein